MNINSPLTPEPAAIPDPARVGELEAAAKNIRRTILELVFQAKASHVGCSLSAADILTALYFEVMRIDPRRPDDPSRDIFVLSKGHAISALYATLAERGFFPREVLQTYGRNGTALASHVVRGSVPGTETSNGSGGHGPSLAAGLAWAARGSDPSRRIFVLAGDGEMEEGSIWEALLFAGHHGLNNLTLIADRNHLQDGADGSRTDDILDLEPFEDKLRSFRWETVTVDGHDFRELIPALRARTSRPRAIIARTVKGKGVSIMENKGEWHGKSPDESEFRTALQELAP